MARSFVMAGEPSGRGPSATARPVRAYASAPLKSFAPAAIPPPIGAIERIRTNRSCKRRIYLSEYGFLAQEARYHKYRNRQVASQDIGAGIGTTLQRQRMSQRVTLEEIVQRTRIPLRHL